VNPGAQADDYLGKPVEKDLHMRNDAKKTGLGVAASVGALTFLYGLSAQSADAPAAGQLQNPSIQAPGTIPQQQAPGKLQPPQQQAPTPTKPPPQQQAPVQPERPPVLKPPGQPGQQQGPAQTPRPPQV
jgi:hypothetical protein